MKPEEMEAAVAEVEVDQAKRVEATQKIMLKALEILQRFQVEPMSFQSVSMGAKELTRSGMKRQVEYLEVGLGNETFVLEVYTK